MSVTLNGSLLTVVNWSENFEVIASAWDEWENGACRRKEKVRGAVRTYTLDCVESGGSWPISLAKYFEAKALEGGTLPFVSTLTFRSVNGTVYILNVDFSGSTENLENAREYTLTLQES